MKKGLNSIVIACIGLLALILDTKTALSGATEGVELCIRTVIPSLFPFIFLSVMLNQAIMGMSMPFLKPLCHFLRIPEGAESLLLLGLLGGYPVGAQCCAEAVRYGNISRETGRRMLSFCSNAGPAFLFGIGSTLFTSRWKCWVLWAIHILSALIVGHIMPRTTDGSASISKKNKHSASLVLQQSLRIMANISGWVILFRVIFVFSERWFLWYFPQWTQSLFAGVLELTNGCCSLTEIGNEDLRFVLCSLFLGFGGFCVTMQTYSVCIGVDTSLYLPGKVLQSVLSAVFALCFISREMAIIILAIFALSMPVSIYLKKRKIQIAFFLPVLYNDKKVNRR